jgi:DNA-binding MarR family transcriptional regulator
MPSMHDELQRIAREIEPAFPVHAARLRSLARKFTPLPGLTPKQRRAFDYICDIERREHRTPLLREIAQHMGWSTVSLSGAHEIVGRLVDKGYIKRNPVVPGSITICAEALHG